MESVGPLFVHRATLFSWLNAVICTSLPANRSSSDALISASRACLCLQSARHPACTMPVEGKAQTIIAADFEFAAPSTWLGVRPN